jgi:hypothetical protein
MIAPANQYLVLLGAATTLTDPEPDTRPVLSRESGDACALPETAFCDPEARAVCEPLPAGRDESLLIALLPDSVSRFKRFKSVRSPEALW